MPRTMEDAALALPSVKARQVASAMRDLEKRRAAAFGVDSHRTRAAASAPTLDENILVLEPFMEMILQAIQQLQDAACEQATQADVDFATSVVDSLIPPRAASDVATDVAKEVLEPILQQQAEASAFNELLHDSPTFCKLLERMELISAILTGMRQRQKLSTEDWCSEMPTAALRVAALLGDRVLATQALQAGADPLARISDADTNAATGQVDMVDKKTIELRDRREEVRKRAYLSVAFYTKDDHFTKTGSGQT
jgi:hypothetical protein